MRRTISLIAACVAVVAVAAASAVAAPGPKSPKADKTHGGTVSLVAPSPALGATTTTASGNVKSQASCRKNRTVHVAISGGAEVIATTRSNGNYSATVTLPANASTGASTQYTLTATVDQANRKSGKGHGARKHVCGALSSAPATVTVTS